ncbi:hypothetical protein ACFQ3P_00190 [Paraburkholderia sabiae]|jgi:hypothetical protein|uniref:Uncharacterized protein n=1 Tax=Paraburkholderia sabiae TaxID=273251 RepID=A0ABU9Q8G6_9BURK|nr:hypothetical protein [Paraburkholderia sabiae]WJZ78307.1 hypothetical protein QEN71_30400 [Paraburkholderia sabiae]CAD6507074.1 hypothetical protein LMG24235_00037 [Paraburkholderia sabiae]
MKPYVVLLAAWMAAFSAASMYSAHADGPVIVALANPSSDLTSGFDSPLVEQEHHDRHKSSTPSPAIIHGPSYLSALREYDVRSLARRFSYSPSSGFTLNNHGE